MPDPVPTESARERPAVGGPLALAAVTLGLLAWPIAFNLGAYGEIFYDNIFQVVVASSILFVITTVNGSYDTPWNWLIRIALAAPLGWLLAAAYLVGSTSEALDRPAFAVALILILLVSVPLTLRLLIDMSMPELTESRSRRVTASVVALVIFVGAIGFVVGRGTPSIPHLQQHGEVREGQRLQTVPDRLIVDDAGEHDPEDDERDQHGDHDGAKSMSAGPRIRVVLLHHAHFRSFSICPVGHRPHPSVSRPSRRRESIALTRHGLLRPYWVNATSKRTVCSAWLHVGHLW